jgi:hypothetical protein
MASPYQQQVRFRKILYFALILVLFTVALGWRRYVIAGQAEQLAVREENRGEVDLTGAVVRLGLTGSRGLATCFLWNNAMEKQKKNQWNELEVLVRSLTKLQPHFITPWLFQSWNLAYNVSVESDRIRDKFFYVSRGIELLGQGERQNRDHPDLRWSIGFYTQHKVMQSDETNYIRSLFQLSLIPPNERDPARFWKQTDQEVKFNYAEFEQFCKDHPQLVRRLREGMHRENLRERKRLFDCPTPEAVVRFLDDNFQVPSLYKQVPAKVDNRGRPLAAHEREWAKREDELLPLAERFPVLPPPADAPERKERKKAYRPFDKDALTTDSKMGDEVDAFWVSHAWFCYAQEPIPAPGEMPGSTQEITDRTGQRRPKHMTTLIFRSYPAQGRRYIAERLQIEGWFDDEDWDISDWFQGIRDPLEGKTVKIGGGPKWSQDAWLKAFHAWEKHGKDNHLLFDTPVDEQNTHDRAMRYATRHRLQGGAPPPRVEDESRLSDEEREEYKAARFIFELNFYRNVSNYMHHYHRTMVEKEAVTVACKKLFDRAEQFNLLGESLQALNAYRTPIDHPAWRPMKLSPLEAWKKLVLLRNKAYRRDSFTQEATAEYQLRYLLLYNRQDGRDLKQRLGKAAPVLPLVPKMGPEVFRPPVVQGPFDDVDDEGVPLVEDRTMDLTTDRMGLPTRRILRQQPPPGMMMPPGGPPMPARPQAGPPPKP